MECISVLNWPSLGALQWLFVLKTDERFVSEVCMLVRLAGIINPTDHVCWDKREWACFAPSFQGVLACPPKIATVRKMIFTST